MVHYVKAEEGIPRVMVQPSEIADLLMMMVLGPIILIAVRRAIPALIPPVAIALGLMAMGYVSTILEGFFLPDFFNLMEHASYGFAGLVFVWLLLSCRRLLGLHRAGSR